jgi:hypothetical protein
VGVRVVLWSQPGSGLEKAVKVSGTHFNRYCELVQTGKFISLLDHPTRGGNRFGVLAGEPGTLRSTTLASTETCLFGVLRRIVKGDILAFGQACRTGRTAIDTGGFH